MSYTYSQIMYTLYAQTSTVMYSSTFHIKKSGNLQPKVGMLATNEHIRQIFSNVFSLH